MKVLVVYKGLAERIRARLPEDIEVIYPEVGTDEELVELVRDVEVIVSTRLSPVVAENAPKLKLLQKTGAGVDDMPFDALKDDAYMANTSGSNPVPLAEGAVSLVWALAKRIIPRHKTFMGGRESTRGVLLMGKTAGILGMGAIGSEVAKRLKAMGMRVIGLRRERNEKVREELGIDWLGGVDELDYLMSESDFLVVTVPLTPDTKGMLGEHEFSLMKEGSYVVNVARAAIIQEKPLYDALKSGKLAGAGIDVWWQPHFWEPLWNVEGNKASKYPYWEMDNVICIANQIGSSDSQSDASLKIMVENIIRTRDGLPPVNQVDKKYRY
jgi:phosphoglycerate dehydrogenase-like enzyme